jgi:hypothetical protein
MSAAAREQANLCISPDLRYAGPLTELSRYGRNHVMRRLVRIVALVAVVTLLGSVTATANHSTENLIHNGSFEKDANADLVPDAWVMQRGAPAYFHVDGSAKRHGDRGGEAGNSGDRDRYRAVQFIGGITPGMTYQFTGYARSTHLEPNAFSVSLSMAWFGDSGVIAVDPIHEITTHLDEWETITATLTAPQGTAYAVLRINVVDMDNGKIGFDTFSLTPIVD